jgi:hypothetical protein
LGGTAGLCGRENDVTVAGDNGGGRDRVRAGAGCGEPRTGSKAMLKPLNPATEGGRPVFTDGGFGGGASGGGSFGGNGVEFVDVEFELIIFERAFS